MPANSAGRMYFNIGSPNAPYYDFTEFTVGASSINVDTTRVDRFGLKLALLLRGHDGSNQEAGENYATFKESRSATFARFQSSVPTEFKELATDQAPYGIPSPGNDPAFQPGGAYASYFTSYAAANGDTSDSTAQIFGCGGTLSASPTLCAGLNRHVAQLPAAQQTNPANFYLAAPANYYAQFWPRARSTACSTASPTTTTRASRPTFPSLTRSTWSSPSAGDQVPRPPGGSRLPPGGPGTSAAACRAPVLGRRGRQRRPRGTRKPG